MVSIMKTWSSQGGTRGWGIPDIPQSSSVAEPEIEGEEDGRETRLGCGSSQGARAIFHSGTGRAMRGPEMKFSVGIEWRP